MPSDTCWVCKLHPSFAICIRVRNTDKKKDTGYFQIIPDYINNKRFREMYNKIEFIR